MGRLAELAGTKNLTGPVTVTLANGLSCTFESEAAALDACGSTNLFHHRGAFYERGCSPRGHVPTASPSTPKLTLPPPPAPKLPDPPEPENSETPRARRRRRRSEDSE